jgi:uncharacterized protein GlcG (DUF336 family)
VKLVRALAVAAAACVATAVAGEAPSFTIRVLTPEAALKAAQSALAKCRAQGYQVAVAVVDRSGITQVLLRDRHAGPHTVEVATNKAWTAVSFKTSTRDLERLTRPGETMSGLRNVPRFVAIGGGVIVEAGGSLLGAVAVSGAPGGDADHACAAAGVEAIAEDLELQ